jgi:hypothetical protein
MERNTLDETFKMIPEKDHRMMTPDHPYGCKRRIFDDGWRACMNDSRFTLTNRKIVSVGRRHITDMIKPALKGDAAAVEVMREAVDRWTDAFQRGLKETVFADCASWYVNERGYNSTLYS